MNCYTPTYLENSDEELVSVPCGKCLICLANKRQDWAFRLMQEYRASKGAVFITLTYANNNQENLSKRHFQLFMKRLRKQYDRLRYYAVGEYGSKRGRPHYHAVIFNLDVDARKLQSIWKHGICHVGKVTEASCMYVTKYVVQSKLKSDHRTPPFALMSRAYGLGLNYLTDAMVAWHREDDRNYAVKDGQKVRLPRYYKDKIWYNKEKRKKLSEKAALEAQIAKHKNEDDLRSQGYDPKVIIPQMRKAYVSRIKQKLAFTQTF